MTPTGLSAHVRRLAEAHRVPGFVAGVIHGDEVLTACTGVTSTTEALDVDERTLFLIGSTTKTLTATALLAQVSAGRLALDTLVREVMPDLRLADPAVLDQLTVTMLLNHTAGWRGDAVVDTGWGDDALRRAVDEALASEPQLRPPGRAVSYNNSAFLLAGRLLEVVTGEDYATAVRHTVLEPLGMSGSTFLPWEAVGRRLAVGHLETDAGAEPVPGWPLTRASGPAGGLACTLTDQLRWAGFCLDGRSDGEQPIPDDLRLQMQRPTADARSGITGVGLSWLLQDRGGVSLVTHGGNVSNLQLGTFVLAPAERLAVVATGNSRGAADAGRELVDLVLAEFGVPDPAPLPEGRLDPVACTGRYDAGSWDLHVTENDGRWFVEMVLPDSVPAQVRALFARPPVEVLPVGTDQLALATRPFEPAGDFGRDATGAVTWFRWGMRIAARRD